MFLLVALGAECYEFVQIIGFTADYRPTFFVVIGRVMHFQIDRPAALPAPVPVAVSHLPGHVLPIGRAQLQPVVGRTAPLMLKARHSPL